MEISYLEQGLRHISGAGNTLNLYEITRLQVALLSLQKQERKEQIFFWGRIRGQDDEYYIAYTLEDSEYLYPKKKMFFSTGNFEFKPLPAPDLRGVKDKTNSFILYGDPTKQVESLEGDKTEATDVQSEEEENEAESKKREILREVDLLSLLVYKIDFATSAVPRRAHRLHGNKIIPAAEFKGLSAEEAEDLACWVHFRPAEDLEALRALTSQDYKFNTDFLECLQSDVPRGSWATRFNVLDNCVTLRSLLWPGYVAFALLNSSTFGGAYFGSGEERVDLPFLL